MAKVFAATQMKPVFGDLKPNCLIIDEIDGISGGEKNAIKHLLKLVAPQKKKSSSKKSEGTPTKKNTKISKKGDEEDQKKKGGPRELRRPIICICNDQYAPALRDLRNYALGSVFPIPSNINLNANHIFFISVPL